MSTAIDHGTCREEIRRTLAQRAGDTPGARVVAEATIATWHQVATRLAPVIGVRGVDVLLTRSLYLTANTLPWLAIAGDDRDSSGLLASLGERLAGLEPAAATEASYTLLTTFTGLLASLIGESLTERLLSPVWAPPEPASKQETRHE